MVQVEIQETHPFSCMYFMLIRDDSENCSYSYVLSDTEINSKFGISSKDHFLSSK